MGLVAQVEALKSELQQLQKSVSETQGIFCFECVGAININDTVIIVF